MPSDPNMASTADSILTNFTSYTTQHAIYINPLISPHRFPGRGLGIRANSSIPPKTRLMHMPTKAIVKWSDVPADFMPSAPPPAEAGRIRVHSRLASWFAFGEAAKEKHGRWMDTWPGMGDFERGMPGLWPERFTAVCMLGEREANVNGQRKRSNEKPASSQSQGFAILPPGIAGHWATLPASATSSTGILAPQQQKFECDLTSARKFYPELSDRSSSHFKKFMHAWCCVNTRCFSYWPTWQVRDAATSKSVRPPPSPEDRDEAMAMCPGMDLFNHTSDEGDGLCCSVAYDRHGFTIVSPDVKVEEGEELFISYGAHTEEDLWVEYGFMLGGWRNKWDGVNIDAVVFGDRRITENLRGKLMEAGYEGGYTLRRDGVCWRTEMAARLLVMRGRDWEKLVEGTYADSHDGVKEVLWRQMVQLIVKGWMGKVQGEAENSLRGLEGLTEEEARSVLGEWNAEGNEGMHELVKARREMCLARWRQMLEICRDALAAMDE